MAPQHCTERVFIMLTVASIRVKKRSWAAAQVNTGCIFSWRPSVEIALEHLLKLVSALADGGRAIEAVGAILHASTSASSGGMLK